MTPLLYVHGSGHTHESFEAQLAAFPDSDAVSLPGHPEGVALTSVADSAVWLAKYLRWRRADKAIVAGNSLGGAIAIEWALQYPEQVAGLVLLATGGRLRVSAEIFEMIDGQWPQCIDTLVEWSVAPSASSELRARMKEWHTTVGQASTRQDYANCNGWDAMDRLASIKVPTLIVVGSEDRMTPPKYSRTLHDKIAGSELAVIEDAGHMAHAEKAAEVNALIHRVFSKDLA
jgi:pimeloyl-ACP methyl ester carboxylesterase